MWINYKDEIKSVSDKIINDYLEQVDIMINNMRNKIIGTDGTYEKMISNVISNTKNNNTFENQWFLKKFLKDDAEEQIIDKVELSMYEGLLKISTILLRNYIEDFCNILKKQKLSNKAKGRLISNFINDNSNVLQEFSRLVMLECGLELADAMEKIKFSYLINFIGDKEDFFIEYRQDDYVVGVTEEGLKKALKEMNEFGIKTSPEENILIEKKLGYYLEEKEIENSNEIQNYISNYKILNKMAYDNGFELDRVSGSHGVFKNEGGKVIIIPQGRSIGKGLSFKIQRDIIENC